MAQDERIAELETQNKRIAELEADKASLTAEVTELRLSIEAVALRKRLPTPAAALKGLVGALGLHEPAGVLGTLAVTVPTGTTTVAGDAFTRCEGLAAGHRDRDRAWRQLRRQSRRR